MNCEDGIDLTMRAPYIPMNESDDLPLLTEDLMWSAFSDEPSLHKDIKDAIHNESIKESNLASLFSSNGFALSMPPHHMQHIVNHHQQQLTHHQNQQLQLSRTVVTDYRKNSNSSGGKREVEIVGLDVDDGGTDDGVGHCGADEIEVANNRDVGSNVLVCPVDVSGQTYNKNCKYARDMGRNEIVRRIWNANICSCEIFLSMCDNLRLLLYIGLSKNLIKMLSHALLDIPLKKISITFR